MLQVSGREVRRVSRECQVKAKRERLRKVMPRSCVKLNENYDKHKSNLNGNGWQR